jgi:hypothetical protein
MVSKLHILSNSELVIQFVTDSKRFIIGIDKGLPYINMYELHTNLLLIREELDKRSALGRVDR